MELLERGPYLTELDDLLRQAAAGQGRLVLLGGEAGVGKTALVRRFGEDAPASARLLAGSCDPLSTPRPLGPLLDIAAATGGELDLLARAAAPRHQLFGAFLAELGRGSGPAVVVMEDLHWADEASLDLLLFLGRRLDNTRGLVIATYRDDEVGPTHPLQLVLGDLAYASAVRRMALPPLSVDAVGILVKESGLDPVALHWQTGGNPFFVTEVLAAGEPGIPATIRDAVLARAARLPAASRVALDAAAAIGSPIEPWLLAAVVDTGTDAVEACMASGMLRPDGKILAFRHELARVAVLTGISPVRRQELHARVLDALRSAASDPARLAHHAEEAGDREAVLAYAPIAAARAAALRAHREAMAQYARALRFADGLPPDRLGALLDGCSYESYLTDHLAEAIDACQAALSVWRDVGDPLKVGDTTRRLSRLFNFAGRNAEAEDAARAALDVLEELPPGPELAMAYSNVSLLYMLAWNSREARTWGEKAIALAERFGETEVLVHALLNVGAAGLIDDIDDDQARETCERSLRLARENDLMEHAARAYAILAGNHVEAYQFDRANAYFTGGIAYCTEHDLDYMRPFLLAWRAAALAYQGQWAEAYELALAVVHQETMPRVSRIVALVALGRVRARQGDASANTALDEALDLAMQSGELRRLGPVRLARAEAAWLTGDPDRVVAEATDLFDLVVRRNHPRLAGELAFWLWRVGALDSAPPGALEPFALQMAGNWSEAAARWRALGCPYEAAWALADGDDESSLRCAHAEFGRLGAAPAAGIVAQRLRKMGARRIPRGPRPTTRANPAHLTPREMEVLALLARGTRNAEIAERLFLSPRTVAHHVSAILTKLGVHSRSEAVQVAARLGIAGQNGHLIGPK